MMMVMTIHRYHQKILPLAKLGALSRNLGSTACSNAELPLATSRDGTGSEPLTRDLTRPDPDAVDQMTRPGH